MSRIIKVCAVIIVCVALVYAQSATVYAGRFPDTGTIYYDGYEYVSSFFKWYNPGPWTAPIPDSGYEHDLAVPAYYFSACMSWTSLPSGYDDCPTAGYSEDNPYIWVFSFGTFHAPQIQANTWYWCAWSFDWRMGDSASFTLSGQEVYRKFCSWYNIWCMGGVDGGVQTLKSGVFHRGAIYQGEW